MKDKDKNTAELKIVGITLDELNDIDSFLKHEILNIDENAKISTQYYPGVVGELEGYLINLGFTVLGATLGVIFDRLWGFVIKKRHGKSSPVFWVDSTFAEEIAKKHLKSQGVKKIKMRRFMKLEAHETETYFDNCISKINYRAVEYFYNFNDIHVYEKIPNDIHFQRPRKAYIVELDGGGDIHYYEITTEGEIVGYERIKRDDS